MKKIKAILIRIIVFLLFQLIKHPRKINIESSDKYGMRELRITTFINDIIAIICDVFKEPIKFANTIVMVDAPNKSAIQIFRSYWPGYLPEKISREYMNIIIKALLNEDNILK